MAVSTIPATVLLVVLRLCLQSLLGLRSLLLRLRLRLRRRLLCICDLCYSSLHRHRSSTTARYHLHLQAAPHRSCRLRCRLGPACWKNSTEHVFIARVLYLTDFSGNFVPSELTNLFGTNLFGTNSVSPYAKQQQDKTNNPLY